MATAAKLALVPPPELSVAEEYARLTGEELAAASRETSRIYNGIVLARAVVIVQVKLHVSSLSKLARMLNRGTTIVYRWAEGTHPIRDTTLEHALRDLVFLLDEHRR